MRFWRGFGSQVGAKLGPSWLKNGTKFEKHRFFRGSDANFSFWTGFCSEHVRFWRDLKALGPLKIEPPLQREHEFWLFGFSNISVVLGGFGVDFGGVLASKLAQKFQKFQKMRILGGSRRPLKFRSFLLLIFEVYGVPFGCQLGSNLAPKMAPRRARGRKKGVNKQ